MIRLSYRSKRFFRDLEAFFAPDPENQRISGVVADILKEVRNRGDEAVLEFTRTFDGFSGTARELRIPPGQLARAPASLNASQRRCIREAIRCVREFHRRGLPRDWMGRNPHGARVGEKWYPISRVGIYIPAGSVPLVSTVVMTTTLARLAGVPSIAVFTPAGPDGRISSPMLAGLHLCGIEEVYRVGGAQAIGAMAFGTATIPAVKKIMGPGNAYVAEAQRQVFGTVGIDLLPGPSEALVIADHSAHPAYVAADLLAQAEHGSGRERITLVHMDRAFSSRVEAEAEALIGRLKHAPAIRRIWEERTCFIEVPGLPEAIDVAQRLAPEHLELHVEADAYPACLAGIRTAGAILCGHDTPTVVGDFTAGPSHTLPTALTGHFFSGLKITDFMRRSSVVEYDRQSLGKAREVIRTFSQLEDLDAHGFSCEVRFSGPDSP